MKRRLLLSLLLPLLAACESDPTRGNGAIALVVVMPDARTLAVGETLELEATVRDRGGEEPATSRMARLAWSSDAPAVATVANGVVTGVAPGTATIRAELEGVRGSVTVTVAGAPESCDTPGAVRALGVGETLTLGGIAASTFCLDGGEAGAEYLVLPYHAGRTLAGFASVRITGEGIVAPTPLSSRTGAPALLLEGRSGPAPDRDFHHRLRARAERELAPHVPAALAAGRARGEGAAPSFSLQLSNPTMGQEVQVNSSLESCVNPRMRTGRVMAIGTRAVVLADTENPGGGLTVEDYSAFAAGFDTLVWPQVTQAFGEPHDVDGNGRVVIFFTRAVNELTPPGSGSYVGGYFHPRDLFPRRARDGLAACEASNVAELFYMLVPDPTGSINNNPFSVELVRQTSLGTIAHEFQHLVNASRRLYMVGTTHWNEEVWLNEAMSHLAEEMIFYRASGLGPRQNVAHGDIQGNARRVNAYLNYQDQNLRRYQNYLEFPESQSPYDAAEGDNNDLATRGAGWSFLRYTADRWQGTDEALMKRLVDGSITGLANLRQALDADPHAWLRDWAVSVFADDLVPGLAPRHTQPSWNFRSFWETYPLVYRELTEGETNLSVKSGTGGFVRTRVPAGGTGRFTAMASDELPLGSEVSVVVLRTR